MKRTHLSLKTGGVARLMVAVTAIGVLVVTAFALLGGSEFIATDIATESALARDNLLTPAARDDATREHSGRSNTALCPQPDLQSDDLWNARATARCFRRLDRGRGLDR
jgi:hypothetical protein